MTLVVPTVSSGLMSESRLQKIIDLANVSRYYDLVRSGMLKYRCVALRTGNVADHPSLQARIGNMDGIFVAYHNTRRMFGFQYLPL